MSIPGYGSAGLTFHLASDSGSVGSAGSDGVGAIGDSTGGITIRSTIITGSIRGAGRSTTGGLTTAHARASVPHRAARSASRGHSRGRLRVAGLRRVDTVSLAVRAELDLGLLASTDTAETRERIRRADVQAWAVVAERPVPEAEHPTEAEDTVAGVTDRVGIHRDRDF